MKLKCVKIHCERKKTNVEPTKKVKKNCYGNKQRIPMYQKR